MPTGRPLAEKQAGIEMAGRPAILTQAVKKSKMFFFSYIYFIMNFNFTHTN